MMIPINDKYRITSDQYQWIVERRQGMRKNKQTQEPEENWRGESYYPTLAIPH